MLLKIGIISVASIVCEAPASPISDGMTRTLETMAQAVVEGDRGAYMAMVYSADEKFLTEQRAWFDDLARNPVKSFTIEASEVVRYGPSFSPAVIAVKYQWTLERDGIERSFENRIRLRPLNRNTDGPWLLSGRDWDVIQSSPETGLRVYADQQHGELAEGVFEITPGILSAIESEFGEALSEPLSIKIYPTMQELQFSIAPGYLDPLSGWNEPGESIKILGRDEVSAERISTLLAHEIGHAVSFEFGESTIDAPWWTLEGIAELVADEYRSDSIQRRELRVAKQVARGDRRTWEQLSDFKGEALNHTGYVYAHGWSMIRFITKRFGADARNNWFTQMGQGESIEIATQSVFGISFEQLDEMWESEMLRIAKESELDAERKRAIPQP